MGYFDQISNHIQEQNSTTNFSVGDGTVAQIVTQEDKFILKHDTFDPVELSHPDFHLGLWWVRDLTHSRIYQITEKGAWALARYLNPAPCSGLEAAIHEALVKVLELSAQNGILLLHSALPGSTTYIVKALNPQIRRVVVHERVDDKVFLELRCGSGSKTLSIGEGDTTNQLNKQLKELGLGDTATHLVPELTSLVQEKFKN